MHSCCNLHTVFISFTAAASATNSATACETASRTATASAAYSVTASVTHGDSKCNVQCDGKRDSVTHGHSKCNVQRDSKRDSITHALRCKRIALAHDIQHAQHADTRLQMQLCQQRAVLILTQSHGTTNSAASTSLNSTSTTTSDAQLFIGCVQRAEMNAMMSTIIH